MSRCVSDELSGAGFERFISSDRVVDDAWTEMRSGERVSAYSKLSSVVTSVSAYSVLSSFAVFVFAAHSFGLSMLFPSGI